jgi:hypothetical protein
MKVGAAGNIVKYGERVMTYNIHGGNDKSLQNTVEKY